MAALFQLAMSNFSVTFFVVSVLAGLIAIVAAPKPVSASVAVDRLLAYYVLIGVGLSFLYNFVLHVFFGEVTAGFIGWAPSPFQAEVGYASLGFAVVGILAFRSRLPFRFAAVLAPAVFAWGAAVGHIYQIAAAGNLAPGNAGSVLFTDILLPAVGLALVYAAYRVGEPDLGSSA